MNKKREDGFRFLLSVSPKNDSNIEEFNWASKLLMIEPTDTNSKGDILSKKRNMFYTEWYWGYGTKWINYWSEDSQGKSFSAELLIFLKSLPSDEKIWEELSNECNYFLYIPVERAYWLIEVEFEPEVWVELGKRKLRMELSSLSREENT